jgi:hypothetical protein
MGSAAKEAPSKNGVDNALPPQFESFNKTNAIGRMGGEERSTIHFARTGRMAFSKKLAALLKLKTGAGVAFHFDATSETWYVERDDKDGFVIREDAKGELAFNSSVLYRKVMACFPNDEEAGRVMVNEEPERIGHRLLYIMLPASLRPTRKRS